MIPSLTPQMIEQAFALNGITLLFKDGIPNIKDADDAINQRLLRCWQAGTLTPDAHSYQVRAFLIHRNIALSSIPDLITGITAEGPERDEALMRWEYATSAPKSHPLVAAIAQQLDLDLDVVWWEILDIA